MPLPWGCSRCTALALLALFPLPARSSQYLVEVQGTVIASLHLPQFLSSRFCYVWGYPSYSPSCVPKGGTLIILRDLWAVCR